MAEQNDNKRQEKVETPERAVDRVAAVSIKVDGTADQTPGYEVKGDVDAAKKDARERGLRS